MSDDQHHPMDALLELMERLRDPVRGCPWDREQTLTSIAPHTLEECYELVDAIERDEDQALREELGDVLFQVVFLAQITAEQGRFDFADVVRELTTKLIRRHPHVFPEERPAAGEQSPARTAPRDAEGVSQQWEDIKAEERRGRDQDSVLDDVPLALPALGRAAKLQRRAARTGFDWTEVEPVRERLLEELGELEEAREQRDHEAMVAELGDVLFSCVNLARHLEIDPEVALRGANHRFEQRFRWVEAALAARGHSPAEADAATLDRLWQQAKARRD